MTHQLISPDVLREARSVAATAQQLNVQLIDSITNVQSNKWSLQELIEAASASLLSRRVTETLTEIQNRATTALSELETLRLPYKKASEDAELRLSELVCKFVETHHGLAEGKAVTSAEGLVGTVGRAKLVGQGGALGLRIAGKFALPSGKRGTRNLDLALNAEPQKVWK